MLRDCEGSFGRSPDKTDLYNLPQDQESEFGQAAEYLRLIYNSGERQIFSAINCNLEVFAEAVRRKNNEGQLRRKIGELNSVWLKWKVSWKMSSIKTIR